MIKSIELAYFAGFFDGEGSIGIYAQKYVVSLTNCDMRPLKRAQELWGGFISVQRRGSLRFAIRDLYRWQIYGHGARPFLEAVRPFVLLKGDQIDAYLAVMDVLPTKIQGRKGHGKEVWEVIDSGASKLHLLKRGIA